MGTDNRRAQGIFAALLGSQAGLRAKEVLAAWMEELRELRDDSREAGADEAGADD